MRGLLRALLFVAAAVGMPRFDASGNRFMRGEDVSPAPSAARAASGDSGWLNCREWGTFDGILDVTAVGGDANETLDVVVETRTAGGAARSVGSFAQRTQPGGAGNERKSFGGLGDEYRIRWTLAGTTPTFTFSVTGALK